MCYTLYLHAQNSQLGLSFRGIGVEMANESIRFISHYRSINPKYKLYNALAFRIGMSFTL